MTVMSRSAHGLFSFRLQSGNAFSRKRRIASERHNDAFRKRYNYAREAQAHYYADLIRDVAFDDN
jgi:hypothetical protein